MPSRNIRKISIEDGYYHIYSRGVDRLEIFLEKADYGYFLSLIDRYLSSEPRKSNAGIIYPNFKSKVDILCYCLMPTHYHFLVNQKAIGSMSKFMASIDISYSRYFNKKYKRTGPLFESRYKGSLITSSTHLEHLTRYIHLNPASWKSYKYSSLGQYIGSNQTEWLTTEKILNLFKDKKGVFRICE